MKRLLLVFTSLILGGLLAYVGQSLLQGQGSGTATSTETPKDPTSYRDIVKKILPAVVSIEAISKTASRRATDEDNPNRVGFGSGFLISSKGVIVTNNHVVESGDYVVVQMANGKKYTSKTIRTDPKTDLAIVMLDTKDALPFLEFGDSNTMEIGDRVLAVGAPFGLTGTVTHGIISSKGRSLRMNMYEDFLQTDAAINPGNSGGPLVNLEGKVIGINSAIKSRSGGFQGIGLAISSNMGKSIVEVLIKDGVVRRGYLGVGIREVDAELAKEVGLKTVTGVQVTRIYPEGPGDKALLKIGDVILTLGGKPIRDTRELQTIVAAQPIGKPVDLEIFRDSKPVKLKVTIEEQPKTFDVGRSPGIPEPGKGAIRIEKVGVTVADLTAELGEALGYPETVRGALITRIDRGGIASRGGLGTGMVIVSVDRKAVTTAKAASTLVNAGSLKAGILVNVRGPRSGVQSVLLKGEE